MVMPDIDHRLLFEASPEVLLVLLPDAPRYTMVAATDARLLATHTSREQVIGRSLFDLFPDNPDDATSWVEHARRYCVSMRERLGLTADSLVVRSSGNSKSVRVPRHRVGVASDPTVMDCAVACHVWSLPDGVEAAVDAVRVGPEHQEGAAVEHGAGAGLVVERRAPGAAVAVKTVEACEGEAPRAAQLDHQR